MTEAAGGKVFQGIAVSDGIAVGRALVVDRRRVQVPMYHVDPDAVDAELARFHTAVAQSVEQVRRISESMKGGSVAVPVQILEAHRLLLTDTMLEESVRRYVLEDRLNVEWALRKTVRSIKEAFDRIDDDYFRERRSDLDFVGQRILRNLAGLGERVKLPRDEETIVVAHELSPIDAARLAGRAVLALVTDVGGPTGHVAIMARALDVPAVVGLEDITEAVGTGDLMIVDGTRGEVIVHPSEQQAAQYEVRREHWQSFEAALLENRLLAAETTDGYAIELHGNIELQMEAASVIDHGGVGIGLYRTEFLFLGRDTLPSEEEQLEAYTAVMEAMPLHPVTLRTLDLGGDKFLSRMQQPPEVASVEGLRAIRLCLKEPSIFRPQLRAMLRASSLGDLRILVPMVSDIGEVRAVRDLLTEVRAELAAEGHAVSKRIPLGVMIEVPAAAAMADVLAAEVDFFSIGTNDLVQYALAVDRINERQAEYYNPLHPALLRMVDGVVRAAAAAATPIPVSICGEMAGSFECIPVLLGLGLRTLSMNAHAIPMAKDVIRGASMTWCEQLAAEALTFGAVRDVESLVTAEVRARYPDLVR